MDSEGNNKNESWYDMDMTDRWSWKTWMIRKLCSASLITCVHHTCILLYSLLLFRMKWCGDDKMNKENWTFFSFLTSVHPNVYTFWPSSHSLVFNSVSSSSSRVVNLLSLSRFVQPEQVELNKGFLCAHKQKKEKKGRLDLNKALYIKYICKIFTRKPGSYLDPFPFLCRILL